MDKNNDFEQASYEETLKRTEQWMNSERFSTIKRPYTAQAVAPLKQTVQMQYPSHLTSKKLWSFLKDAQAKNTQLVTYGAMDPIQVANQGKYQKCVYVSGWQCSASASTTNEPGPDFADYPANTVPNKCDQLFKAMLLQDRIQNQARSQMTAEQRKNTPRHDYIIPMIADADAGFGGSTSMMKLTKLFIEAGAAAIHIEDQRPGNKKCGHMGGKVVVSTRESINRLVAARLQADILECELLIQARTDSLSAKLIDSNIDPIDHPYILGKCADGELRTFPQEGVKAIERSNLAAEKKQELTKQWNDQSVDMSLQAGLKFATDNGFAFSFDWESIRSPEGFYQVQGCVEYCARRAREYLKVADLIWMETPTPDLKLAARFSELVKAYHPTKFLSYNLSPSFNWSAFNMTEEDQRNFCNNLGKLGYVYQFITLAGFHQIALKSEKFSKDLVERGMLAYVQNVQQKEMKHKVDQLTHQKWAGANYVDSCLQLIDSQNQTAASSKESTENQFNQPAAEKKNENVVQI